MTELEPYRAKPTTLEVWSDEARAAANIADALAGTPFVPASLRVVTHGEPDHQATTANITAALLTGQELGLSPMASLRSIDIVNGTPALRAIALRALVQAAGHDIAVVESTATRAIVKGRRANSDNDQISTWTIDRARGLGLAGKDNWRKQPTAMLLARATAECARLIAADAILGLPYIAEELEDGDAAETVETVTAKPAKRTAQRRLKPVVPAPEIAAEPVDDEPPTEEPPRSGPRPVVDAPLPDDEPPLDEPTPGLITKAQLKMLHATLRDIKVTDRDDGLALLGSLAGRDITSSKELTVAEASHVIDELTRSQFTDDDPPA